jgi:hypothetical protein
LIVAVAVAVAAREPLSRKKVKRRLDDVVVGVVAQ